MEKKVLKGVLGSLYLMNVGLLCSLGVCIYAFYLHDTVDFSMIVAICGIIFGVSFLYNTVLISKVDSLIGE
jgi:hypothetical protein